MSKYAPPGTPFTCDHCKIETVTKSYVQNPKYCTKKCAGQAKKAKALRHYNCLFCRTTVTGGPTEVYRGKGAGKYCSSECCSMHRKVSRSVVKPCEQCGKAMVLKTHYQRTKKAFCSQKCHGAFQKSQTSYLTRNCKKCGKAFTFPEHKLNTSQTMEYCSDNCRLFYFSSKDRRREDGSFVTTDGYASIVVDGVKHYQHRYVMSKMIGRALLPHENVHHKNGDRADNRESNLELWSKSQPPGQRVSDKLYWIQEMLNEYKESHRAQVENVVRSLNL